MLINLSFLLTLLCWILKVPNILGRPFLATGRMLIDVQKAELSLIVHNDIVTFNVFNTIKSLDDIKECSVASKMESLISPELERIFEGSHL
ncbi:Retrovirus-related Pol polyprotein from transposon opus [Gossypium australe]|uniref:Retrovirus-related Pol polyprotein from transposon opus n=1 Tax=Gossypium australe TaxID=47621 RepID=A0A5B6WQ22_9ROSI|nr:Retrovirus-related Pol polyprotein from transposon opus [Gossypium australe]